MTTVEWKLRVSALLTSDGDEPEHEPCILQQDYLLHGFEADILTGDLSFEVRQDMAGRILATLIDTVNTAVKERA